MKNAGHGKGKEIENVADGRGSGEWSGERKIAADRLAPERSGARVREE